MRFITMPAHSTNKFMNYQLNLETDSANSIFNWIFEIVAIQIKISDFRIEINHEKSPWIHRIINQNGKQKIYSKVCHQLDSMKPNSPITFLHLNIQKTRFLWRIWRMDFACSTMKSFSKWKNSHISYQITWICRKK